jgi:DNA-binding transcriptional regulator YdaS (Cro superfamily)
MHPFVKALELLGSAKMAGALEVSKQMVSKMKRCAEEDPYYLVPSNHLRAIERATAGAVTVEQLVIERPREPLLSAGLQEAGRA